MCMVWSVPFVSGSQISLLLCLQTQWLGGSLPVRLVLDVGSPRFHPQFLACTLTLKVILFAFFALSSNPLMY